MLERIVSELRRIEDEHSARVLYACESGSRAWGFESTDSDYDVRFIYIHAPEWYLSIRDRRDVIELPVDEGLDISGWDIRKALRLFRKSNPPLLEWLRSPIVYLEQFSTANRLRELTAEFFSPRACLHHYLSMAGGNFREYLRGDEVRVKKYFYVLRPLLACKWIEEHDTVPPMPFEELLTSQVSDHILLAEVAGLLERKRSGEELDLGPNIPAINSFLESEIERLDVLAKSSPPHRTPDDELLDTLFRSTLDEAWRNSIR